MTWMLYLKEVRPSMKTIAIDSLFQKSTSLPDKSK